MKPPVRSALYTVGEEIANSLSHGVGAVIGIGLLYLMTGTLNLADMGRRIADIALEHPATEFASVLTGYSLLDSQYKTNAATVFVSLKGFDERAGVEAVIDNIHAPRFNFGNVQDGVDQAQ